MGQIIQGYDIDEVVYKAAKELINADEYQPRDMKTKELINTTLIIENPKKCIIKNNARKLSKKYLKAELKWYKSQTRSIDMIKKYSSMWEKLADQNGNVNSNYGEIVFKQKLENYKGSQFDWVIDSLLKDKDSRQAIINFNQTKHKQNNIKDFVCTISTQYLIRNNNLLSITNMRSNDFIYGFSYDFPFFASLQNNIYKKLRKEKYKDLQLGKNFHNVGSFHIYEKHFKMLEEIIKEFTHEKFTQYRL